MAQLKAAKFDAPSLRVAGFEAIELKVGGYTAAKIKAAGYDATQLRAKVSAMCQEAKDCMFTKHLDLGT